jgi:hypothetical protein
MKVLTIDTPRAAQPILRRLHRSLTDIVNMDQPIVPTGRLIVRTDQPIAPMSGAIRIMDIAIERSDTHTATIPIDDRM